MKHHFADFIDREGDYWSIVPNGERFSYSIKNLSPEISGIKIITISKDDENWEQIFQLSELEEITLHNPSKEQISSINRLTNIKRLRITHCRLKDIDFIRPLINIEELVLEYVSGFSDLSPLRSLTKLRSLHFENLRRIKDFKGLSGINSLKFLYINGTVDWKQPIENFEFLSGLPNLEVLSLIWVINKSPFPAFKPVLKLNNLKKIKVLRNMFPTEEFAFLELALPTVEGAKWEPCDIFPYDTLDLPEDDYRSKLSDEIIKKNHPEVRIYYDGSRKINDPNSEWFEFLGKSAGRVKCNNPKAEEKCNEFKRKYDKMKSKALKFIAK